MIPKSCALTDEAYLHHHQAAGTIAYEPSTVHTQFNFPPLDVSNAFLNEAFSEDVHMEPSKIDDRSRQHTSVQKFIGRVE